MESDTGYQSHLKKSNHYCKTLNEMCTLITIILSLKYEHKVDSVHYSTKNNGNKT